MESFTRTFVTEESETASDQLARLTGLSKSRVKECMTKGGVWWSRPGRACSRLRRSSTIVRPGESLEINFDSTLLALVPAVPACLTRGKRYSVWDKPPGILAQGTRFADHCCLSRIAQKLLGMKTEPHPVHRLDREARGLMLLAHDRTAAAKFGELFRTGKIEKEYAVIVVGIPDWTHTTVDLPLDDRTSRSHFKVLDSDDASHTSLLTARIETGRRHQIRRHLCSLGLPVLGDPRYGKGNACADGLQLVAMSIAFTCPFANTTKLWTLPKPSFPPRREA